MEKQPPLGDLPLDACGSERIGKSEDDSPASRLLSELSIYLSSSSC